MQMLEGLIDKSKPDPLILINFRMVVEEYIDIGVVYVSGPDLVRLRESGDQVQVFDCLLVDGADAQDLRDQGNCPVLHLELYLLRHLLVLCLDFEAGLP